MEWTHLQSLRSAHSNFILLGEAGSGKSEIALNLAIQLASQEKRPVHFFDLDMTKPLFRARDLCALAEKAGVHFHYEKQFMDAPTQVGGVSRLLRDPNECVVMDVGGDDIGARAVGGYAGYLNRPETAVFFVVNPYRPWSYDVEHIDGTLGKVLLASRIRLENIHFIGNPNNGPTTTLQEFREGSERLTKMLEPYCTVEFLCARQELYRQAADGAAVPVMPLQLYLMYPWLTESERSGAASINENSKNPEGGFANG